MKKILFWVRRLVLYPIFLIIFFLFISQIAIKFIGVPSNDRDWNDDQDILSYSDIKDNLVTIHNVRNLSYSSTTSYTKNYYDKTFDLNKIKKVWYMVEPFSGIPGSAHTLLSFEFEDQDFVSISVEIRKEKGESFHPVKGLFNQYEIMYVIADESDVIKLRSNYRKDKVYLYPIKADEDKVKELFLSMINRANELNTKPEFYNSFTNTCTTNIVKHVNTISDNKISLINPKIILPENSDRLAFDLGLIDTDLPFANIRDRFYINDLAEKYATSSYFSVKIRGE